VNKEKSSDALFGVEIGDERRLHWPDCVPERLPNNRNSVVFLGFGDFRGGAYFLNFGACASGDVLKPGLMIT